MSATLSSATEAIAAESGWSLWRAQVAGLLRLEVKKNLFSRRAIPLYFLSFFMLFIFSLWPIAVLIDGDKPSIGEASMIYATAYQTLMLRLVIFFGCAFTFMNLFRGEILERSLHYYFLTPVRREVLVAGKYLSGQIASWMVFNVTVAITFVLLYLPYGSQGLEFFQSGTGIGHLLAYMGVVVLACLGYGAVFLALGMVFRNPIVPVIAIFGWEGINPFLPATLKKISVIHYLQSLCPVPLSGGPIQILADPSPAWLSIPGILLVTAAVLYLASQKARRLEISYSSD